MKGIAIWTDARMADHDPGPAHPERPARLGAVREALERLGGLAWHRPREVSEDALLRVHATSYLQAVARCRGRWVALDPDTALSPESVLAARLAAGAAVEGVDALIEGAASAAVALVRPPGHHAEADRAMGFCVYNNVAVAAAHAIAAHGRERVLVVDWDVHHGNGTQHSFEERRDVLFFSTHQHPFYPGTGAVTETGRGPGAGYTVNAPLPAGCGDAEYQRIFEAVLEPIAEAYRPEIVLISAGFDAHRDDPLGGMRLSTEGYAGLCAVVRRIADAHAGGRVLLVTEGGYDLDALAESTAACVRILGGEAAPEPPRPTSRGDRLAAELARLHRGAAGGAL